MHLMIPRAFRAFAMDNKGNRAALLLICWTIFWNFLSSEKEVRAQFLPIKSFQSCNKYHINLACSGPQGDNNEYRRSVISARISLRSVRTIKTPAVILSLRPLRLVKKCIYLPEYVHTQSQWCFNCGILAKVKSDLHFVILKQPQRIANKWKCSVGRVWCVTFSL